MATIDLGLVKGKDGISPTIAITDIEGGHRVTVTDARGSNSFNVLDGVDTGIPDGGTIGQLLFKKSDENGDAQWETPTAQKIGALSSDSRKELDETLNIGGISVKKKYHPIRDEDDQPSTYPTFASQVFLNDGSVLTDEQGRVNAEIVDGKTLDEIVAMAKKNPRWGGKAVFFGDSLADSAYYETGKSFVDYIRDMNVFDEVVNHSKAGSSFYRYVSELVSPSFAEAITLYADDIRTADYIFIEYGNNDSLYVDGGGSVDTVKMRARECIDAALALNRTAYVALIVPFYDPYLIAKNDSAYKHTRVVNKYLSETYNLPVISMTDKALITGGDFRLNDGAHFNDAGHRIVAKSVIGQIFNPAPTDYTLNFDVSNDDDLKSNFSFFIRYLKAGGILKIKVEASGIFGIYDVSSFSDSYIQLVFIAYNNGPLLYTINFTSSYISKNTYNLALEQ